MWHPAGDVCLDINPKPSNFGGNNLVVADIRRIPYPDNYFGAVFISHVLEHLETVADARLALSEAARVGGKVFIVAPSRYNLHARLLREHHLWIDKQDGIITISPMKLTERGFVG